jgi:regulator of replication initiation timing
MGRLVGWALEKLLRKPPPTHKLNPEEGYPTPGVGKLKMAVESLENLGALNRPYPLIALCLIIGLITGFLASYAIYQPQIQDLETQLQEQEQQKRNENLKTQIGNLENQVSNLQTENTKIKTQLAEYQTLKEMLKEYNLLRKNPSITEYIIYRHFSTKYGEETTKKFWEIIVGHKGVWLTGSEGGLPSGVRLNP